MTFPDFEQPPENIDGEKVGNHGFWGATPSCAKNRTLPFSRTRKLLAYRFESTLEWVQGASVL
jgi:hypothetical protein